MAGLEVALDTSWAGWAVVAASGLAAWVAVMAGLEVSLDTSWAGWAVVAASGLAAWVAVMAGLEVALDTSWMVESTILLAFSTELSIISFSVSTSCLS